jgi:multiple sugar transport system ATP-binding protein
MDEPLSNLDAKLRNQMRAEIIKLREKVDTTFIYVTHDQVEAMTLGDRIVVMKDGYIQQIGTPQEVFNHPKNQFVAGFIGTPQMNIYEHCALENKDGRYTVDVQGLKVALTDKQNEKLNALEAAPAYVDVGVRPNHIHLADNGIEAKVDVSELMGSELHLHTQSHGKDVVIVLQTAGLSEEVYKSKGKTIRYAFEPELMHLFSEETKENLI